jgi:hypothetical protein
VPGSIGIDVQDSRTAIALLESAGQGAVAAAIVGDGYRPLVPHACADAAWGSQAAEAILGKLGADGAVTPADLAPARPIVRHGAPAEHAVRVRRGAAGGPRRTAAAPDAH